MRVASRWGWVVVAAVLTTHGAVAAAATGPRLKARAALVMDAATGEILWSQNADTKLPPASTTKIMTAILALESKRLGEQVKASTAACGVVPSKVHLKPGQRVVLQDLVYAILLNSANDASVMIAEHLAGSVAAFGDRMTGRARQLGALRTRFRNPHGLTQEGHLSTVRDLATIFRHGLEVPRLREVLSTKSLVITGHNPTRRIALRSHNRLLKDYRIPVIGKTGYTLAAKKCFVGAGRHEGREIIVALLGSTDLWGDAKRLLEYGFGDTMPLPAALQRAKAGSATKRTGARRSTPTRRQAVAKPRTSVARRPPQFAVHVGTFDRIERAKRLQRALGVRGFDASIERLAGIRGQGARYRVRLGPYGNRGQAESTVRLMASQVALPARIVQR